MRQKRGFTMIELLIVMFIIGVLAGAMLLAQRGSEASAQATAIVKDLRIMKSGASLFLHENEGFIGSLNANYAEELGKYMEHGRIINDPVRYSFYIVGDTRWVGVGVDGDRTGTRLNAILEEKSKNMGTSMSLYGSDDITQPPSNTNNVYNKSHVAIWTTAN